MSDFSKIAGAALLDELEKIGASNEMLHVSKARSGRRPLSVDTLLKKEKDGTLYKEAMEIAFMEGTNDGAAAKTLRKKKTAPTRDDTAPHTREDGRENAANVSGPATLLNDIGARGDL